MAEISRVLTAAGLTAASTGLVVYGIGASYASPDSGDMNIGLVVMIIGVIATAIGIVISKRLVEE